MVLALIDSSMIRDYMLDVTTMLGLYYRRRDRNIDTKQREGYSFLLIMLKGLPRGLTEVSQSFF